MEKSEQSWKFKTFLPKKINWHQYNTQTQSKKINSLPKKKNGSTQQLPYVTQKHGKLTKNLHLLNQNSISFHVSSYDRSGGGVKRIHDDDDDVAIIFTYIHTQFQW